MLHLVARKLSALPALIVDSAVADLRRSHSTAFRTGH